MTEEVHARLRALLLLTSIIVLLISIGFRYTGDFESFYIAGTQFLKGLNPYNPELYHTYRSFGMSSLPPAIVLTCLPCLLPLHAAIPVWDIFCLLLWTASIYLWAELLWSRPIEMPMFARLCAVCLLAPLCWAFQTHQVTVAVFFFASLACWAAKRVRPGWAGIAVGLMLMKPHLTFLLAAALFLKTNRKSLFIIGVAAGLLLPYIPFMNTVRPVSDLRTWARTLSHQQTEVFYLDDQGLVSRMASFFPVVARRDAKASNGPGILIPISRGRFLAHIKTAFWIFGCSLWGWWGWSKYRHLSGSALYAGALAWGLLISPYSHFYDGVLLTPLVLVIFDKSRHISRNDDRLFPLFFSFNFMMGALVALASRFSFYLWPLMGWTSVAYCAFAASIYSCGFL